MSDFYICFHFLQNVASSFQFVLGGGDDAVSSEECFVLEQPQDTAFVARYKVPGAGFGSGSGAVVTLTDGIYCLNKVL